MSVVAKCKRCGKELRANDRYAGMPTRCPRCNTINQLPSLAEPPMSGKEERPALATPPKRPLRRNKTWQESAPPKTESLPDICKICGRPIRGKAERFEDVHENVYHLGCYQTQAGEAHEDTCRICQKGFESKKDRVKDVVGFYYHRNCYQEELERQRLEASDVTASKKSDATTETSRKSAPESEPKPEEDDWNLPPDPDDDWELDGEVDDDWMRPDPEELEVEEEGTGPPPTRPKIELPAKPVERSASNPLTRKSESKAWQADGTPAQESSAGAPEAAAPRPAPARPVSAAAHPSSAKPEEEPAAASMGAEPRTRSPERQGKAAASSKRPKPADSSKATTKKKSTTARVKPLPRAKPIEDSPVAALPATPVAPVSNASSPGLPDGLELLPEEAGDSLGGLAASDGSTALPEGLELLPEEPQNQVVDGLEMLDDVPVISASNAVPTTPVAASPAGLESLDGLEPVDGLESLDGLEPLDGGLLGGDGFGTASPDSLTDPFGGQPSAIQPRRRISDNSIPTWLWAVMGVGVAVVVIMLISSVVSVMWTNQRNSQPIADADLLDASELTEVNEAETDAFVAETKTNDFVEEETHSAPDRTASISDRAGGVSARTPPRTRLDVYRLLLEGVGNASTGAFVVFLCFFAVFFSIGLAFQGLTLRIACSMCGEGKVAWGSAIGICLVQSVSIMFASLLTMTIDLTVVWMIDLPVNLAICVATIQFMVPTSTGRAILIFVCQFIVTVVLAFLIAIAVAVGLPVIMAVFR